MAKDWLKEIRERAVAPVIDAVQKHPASVAAVNTRDIARGIINQPRWAPVHAFIRQGADEIAQILPAFPDSVKPVPEQGQMFEPTPQEVFAQKKGIDIYGKQDHEMER